MNIPRTRRYEVIQPSNPRDIGALALQAYAEGAPMTVIVRPERLDIGPPAGEFAVSFAVGYPRIHGDGSISVWGELNNDSGDTVHITGQADSEQPANLSMITD